MTGVDSTMASRVDPRQVSISEDQAIRWYRFVGWARRGVNLTANHCVRRGWDVSLGDGPAAEKLAEDIAKVARKAKFRKAVRDQYVRGPGVLGASGMAMRIPQGEQEQPLTPGKFNLAGVNVYWAGSLYPRRDDIESDPMRENFGEPRSYELVMQGIKLGEVDDRVLHADRVLVMHGAEVPPDMEQDTPSGGRWPYDSLISGAVDSLRALLTAENGMEKGLTQMRVPVIAGPWHALWESGGQAALDQRMKRIAYGVSNHHAFFIDEKAGESITWSEIDLRGIDTPVQYALSKCASDFSQPLTLFAGVAPSGLSTDDISGYRNYEQYIAGEQVEKVEPVIAKFYRTVALGMGHKDIDVDVTFKPLMDPDEKALAEIRKLNAEANAIYWERDGLEDPDGVVPVVAPGGAAPMVEEE